MKIFLLVLTLLVASINSTPVLSQEFSSANTQINMLSQIKEQIANIDSNIQTLETYVNQVVACGDQSPPKHFNGTSCVSINERDPHIATHGKKTLNASSCNASNQAQQFNGSSWSCKTYN